MTTRPIHLLLLRRSGESVYWPCVPQINQTGYCAPLSQTSTFTPADVTCAACRATLPQER